MDWTSHTITYVCMKTKWRETQTPPQIKFGQSVAEILNGLPKAGPLFPYLKSVDSRCRANEFRERCRGLGITGVSLHSYRYAWAERAKTAGYTERFAQLALGHNSKAVHRAYARKAQVTAMKILPPCLCPPVAYGSLVEFKRFRLFEKSCAGLFSEHDVFELELALMADPEAGDLIPGTKGLRKLRRPLTGRGKRGGAGSSTITSFPTTKSCSFTPTPRTNRAT
ncbi:MAG: hypothetical protein ACOZE5_06195 [Verrucomicrobiota bacterium]